MRTALSLLVLCLGSLSGWAQPLPPPPPNQGIPFDAIALALVVIAVGYGSYMLRKNAQEV